MVILIEDLQKSRGYKSDTFYLAVNIADNFLFKRAQEDQPAPCMLTLAVTSVIIAAKIEEKNMPRILNMTDLLYDKHGVELTERHGEESQGALEMMMKLHKLYEKPGEGEKNTYNVDITEEMTKKDVLNKVLGILKEV